MPELGDIQWKIEQSRDLVDRLTQKIPGFEGYVEKAELYDADKIIRNFMADRISGYKEIVDEAMRDAQKKGDTGILPEMDSLNLVLERVLKKCRFGDYGSADISRIKIKMEEQHKILEYDWNLLKVMDDMDKDIESLKGSEISKINEIIDSVKMKVGAFEKSFDKRKSAILEVI